MDDLEITTIYTPDRRPDTKTYRITDGHHVAYVPATEVDSLTFDAAQAEIRRRWQDATKYPQPHPVPPALLIHLVLDDGGHLHHATLDEVRAHEDARRIRGLVAAVPASADYR